MSFILCAITASKLPLAYPSNVPYLFLPAAHDAALPLSIAPPELLEKLFPAKNIERVVLEEGDHWVLQVSRVAFGDASQVLTCATL